MLKYLREFLNAKYLVLFTLFATNLVDQPAPEVRIHQGIVSGITSDDGTFFQYLGIPYATANRTNRFQAPLPPPTWSGVYKAVDSSQLCPQNVLLAVIGTEDCLKINVYVPVNADRPLPVMFYIHGGAFMLGSGGPLVYGPEFLVKRDVILVTFNYRLGPLGFLCLGIKEAPGNAGLKDQLAALKWTSRNIAAFGGDPDNITIFGTSAGGTSVSLMLVSEAAEGLFQKAILQSGSSLSNWAINRYPIVTASSLARDLGYNTTDPYELYEIFSKTHYVDLVGSDAKLRHDLFFDLELLLYYPCVEERIPGVEPFLTDIPYNLLKNKNKTIPLMFGSNSREGLIMMAAEKDLLQKRNELYAFSSDLHFQNKSEAESKSDDVKKFYYGDDIINENQTMSTSDHITHMFFEIPVILESGLQLDIGNENVYNYYFNYDGGRNFVKYLFGLGNEFGACHGDDLLYLFSGTIWPFRVNEADRKIIDWFTKMWANFAKYGDPTPPEDSEIPVRWEPSNKDGFKFLYIDKELKMGPMPNPEAYQLWKDLYTKHRRKNLKTPNILTLS